MAIYHLNAKVISRGKGKSATAAAAYRAAEKIYDERTGLTFDYSRKSGVYATEILAPTDAPQWVKQRERLWNEVERRETRSNSRVAREFDIALPVELTHNQKQELVRGFVREQLVSQSLVADLAFHNINSHNPHVHILLTTRKINQQGFAEKERSLDRKDFLLRLRKSWSVYANRALEQAGVSESIDHRTLEEQGINRIPQIHLGPDVAAMREKGIATARGDEYERIQQVNAQLKALLEELAANSQKISEASERKPAPSHPSTAKGAEVVSLSSMAQAITSEPYTQAAGGKSDSPEKSFLTDAQLLAAASAVKQWQKNSPRQPDLGKGKSLKKQISDLEKRKANLAQVLKQKQQELSALGKPRSLLNPFGVSESVIIEKQIEIQDTQTALYATKGELNRTLANFKDWQKQAKAYLAWQEDPQTQKMSQLYAQLKSPAFQERLQYLREGYAIYDAAQSILKQQGTPSLEGRYFQGQFYRIEQRGQTLTITHKDREQSLIVAQDQRQAGGIIEISQFNLTEPDKQMVLGYAQQLKQQQQQKSQLKEKEDRAWSR